MKVIKEIRLGRDHIGSFIPPICVVRTNCYGSQLSHFLNLFLVARETYPTLTESDVKVVQYGGISYSGTFGIEFTPPIATVQPPDGWAVINELEKTR